MRMRKQYFVYENQTKYTFSINATTRLAYYPNENKKEKTKTKLSIEKKSIVPTNYIIRIRMRRFLIGQRLLNKKVKTNRNKIVLVSVINSRYHVISFFFFPLILSSSVLVLNWLYVFLLTIYT